MLIRSQDKRKLAEVKDLVIYEHYDYKDDIIGYFIDGNNDDINHLGYYTNYDKALSVLDMISFSIYLRSNSKEKKRYIKQMKNVKSLKWQRYIKPVFQMPQDSEVE